MDQIKNKTITKILLVNPIHQNDKDYIKNLIYKKEKTCEEEGYFHKINKIIDISFHSYYEQDFSGSVLIKVTFNVDIVCVDVNEIVYCKIVQANEDGIVAEGTYPLYIIINDYYEKLSFLNTGDIIKVKIYKWQISIDKNLIKAAGNYIEEDKEMSIV